MKFFLSLMTLAVVICGCDKEDPLYTPYVVSYEGTYMLRDTTVVIAAATIDSVAFRITDGVMYTLRFYKLDQTDQVNFCDCDGRLGENTSALMTFVPSVVIYTGCDSMMIPRGDFTPDYVNHRPDTVYFERRDGAFLRRMVVVPR